MKVHYRLTLKNSVLHGQPFDSIIIEWDEKRTEEEIIEQCRSWRTEPLFLTRRMNGLNEVEESGLTITPVGTTFSPAVMSAAL